MKTTPSFFIVTDIPAPAVETPLPSGDTVPAPEAPQPAEEPVDEFVPSVLLAAYVAALLVYQVGTAIGLGV